MQLSAVEFHLSVPPSSILLHAVAFSNKFLFLIAPQLPSISQLLPITEVDRIQDLFFLKAFDLSLPHRLRFSPSFCFIFNDPLTNSMGFAFISQIDSLFCQTSGANIPCVLTRRLYLSSHLQLVSYLALILAGKIKSVRIL
jgi:hypothetical protein